MSYTLSIGCGGAMPLEAAIMLQQFDGSSSYERLIEYYLDTRAAFTFAERDVRFDDILGVGSGTEFITSFERHYPLNFVEQIAGELEPPLVAIECDADAAGMAAQVSRDLTLGIDLHHASLATGEQGKSLRDLLARHGRPAVIVGSYSFFVANQAFHRSTLDAQASAPCEENNAVREAENARCENGKDRCLLALLDATPHVMCFIEHPSEIIWAARSWAPGKLPEHEAEDAALADLADNLPRYAATFTDWYTEMAGRKVSSTIGYDPAASRSASLLDIRLP